MMNAIVTYMMFETELEIQLSKKVHERFVSYVKNNDLKKVKFWFDFGNEDDKYRTRIGYYDAKTKKVYQENIYAKKYNDFLEEVTTNPRFKEKLRFKFI